jgi:beta-N-acetylhexosaminidase
MSMSNSYDRSGTWFDWLLLAINAALVMAAGLLAAKLMDPQLLAYRQAATPVLLGVALLGLTMAFWRRHRHAIGRTLLVLAWIFVLGIVAEQEWGFLMARHAILSAHGNDAARLRSLGSHLIAGYERPEDVSYLIRQGYVGGLFLTRRNSEGKTAIQLQAEIATFQEARRKAGLPLLMIVSDQEGGSISRLSPPLPYQPTLASLVTPGLAPHDLERLAYAYGAAQGKALASVGVNTNFSPVLDLKPLHPDETLDFHTLISQRAIASNPQTVSQMGLAYSLGLLSQGILPTLKHFPGLGSADGDTHHFSAHVRLPIGTLNTQDWVPFRTVLEQTPSLLMIGHVILDSVDPENPASLSQKLIRTLRDEWHHNGILITDDMTMAAVYDRGLCTSSVQALQADVDLLLVSYDGEKIYPVMDCLLQADKAGSLSLEASNKRLAQAPWIRAQAR